MAEQLKKWEGLPPDVVQVIEAADLKEMPEDDHWDSTNRALAVVGEVLKKTGDVQKTFSALLHTDVWQVIHPDYWVSFGLNDVPGLEQAADNLTTIEQIDLLLHIISLSSQGLEDVSHYGVVFEKLLREEMPLVVHEDLDPLVSLLEFTTRRTVYRDGTWGGDTGIIQGGLGLLQGLLKLEMTQEKLLSPEAVVIYESDDPHTLVVKQVGSWSTVEGAVGGAAEEFKRMSTEPDLDDEEKPTGYGALVWSIP